MMFRDLPPVEITLGGKFLSEALTGLIEARVVQALAVPAQCELVFRDPPGPLDDITGTEVGAALRLGVTQQGTLFDGVVTAVEHVYTARNERELYIRGYDSLHAMRGQQHARVFKGKSLRSVVQKLAGEASVDMGASVDLPGETPWYRTFQHEQTNLAFLNELCARVGRFPVMRHGKLAIVGLDGVGSPEELVLGQNLSTARVEYNDRWRVNNVVTLGWNPLTGDLLPDGSGSSSGDRVLVNEAVASPADARMLNKNELALRKASTAVFWGEVSGSAAIMPGTRLAVSGLGKPADGLYTATRVVHRLDANSGFITEVSTEPPAAAPRPRGSIITPGVVIDVDDPGNHGRVRAILPTYGEVKTDWMQVLAPGGGRGKGLISTPDVDDLVLVLLVRENPGLGIVLGGVMGKQKTPDSGVKNGRVRRSSWRTPGGLLVELDDSENSIWIGNGDGYIRIENGSIEIAAGSIDFKKR